MNSNVITSACSGAIAALLVCGAFFWPPPSGQIMLPPGPPADHASIAFGATWKTEVVHATNEPVDCRSEAAHSTSQCVLVLSLNAPASATHAILKVKVKAWVMKGGTTTRNYGLIYARAPVPDTAANHFIHAETWGGGPDGKDERRRVTFADAIVQIVDNAVTLEVGKQVNGNALVEIAVYVSGFIKASPLPN